jgi:hypothetical protein
MGKKKSSSSEEENLKPDFLDFERTSIYLFRDPIDSVRHEMSGSKFVKEAVS